MFDFGIISSKFDSWDQGNEWRFKYSDSKAKRSLENLNGVGAEVERIFKDSHFAS